jgi:xylulose-5-phosphate/fructose-6-phosphate phosphoketolase
VVDRLPHVAARAAYLKQEIRDRLLAHRRYIVAHGDDQPEIRNWSWQGGGRPAGATDTAGDHG